MTDWRAPDAAVADLLAARHGDPFALLGPHVGPGGVVVPVLGDDGDGLARGEATAQGLADAFVQLARAGAAERQRLGQQGRAHVGELGAEEVHDVS